MAPRVDYSSKPVNGAAKQAIGKCFAAKEEKAKSQECNVQAQIP